MVVGPHATRGGVLSTPSLPGRVFGADDARDNASNLRILPMTSHSVTVGTDSAVSILVLKNECGPHRIRRRACKCLTSFFR
jgi:hypothetical protein